MTEKLITVSEAVLQLPSSCPNAHMHTVNDYAVGLADYPLLARRYAGAGSTCVVVELQNETFLKVSWRAITPEMGHRIRDCPIIGQPGSRFVNGKWIHWHIQPKCLLLPPYRGFRRPPSHERLIDEVKRDLRANKLKLTEDSDENYGLLRERLVVIDLFSVVALTKENEHLEGMQW
jgi:hypothetical protein